MFATFFLVVSCLAYFSTMEMEAVLSSQMLVNFYLTTWCYIPEDNTFLCYWLSKTQWYFVKQVDDVLKLP
jgi:hypothetical protein